MKIVALLKTIDLVTFTEEILNEKLHFLCGENCLQNYAPAKQ